MTLPFALPGFTEPLNEAANFNSSLFPTALGVRDDESEQSWHGPARFKITTLREFAMLQLMNEITDKPQWNVKIFDDTIAEKWKKEAQQQDDFSERMATYCIEELRWRAKAFAKTGFVFVYEGDVVKSDSAVSDDLKERLRVAVGKLEAIESERKDYHPHSDDKVWDLVHPSLFPLVFGTSRILRDDVIGLDGCMDKIGFGEIAPVPSSEDALIWPRYSRYNPDEEDYSRKFQWLPCDVRLSVLDDETKPPATTNEGHGDANDEAAAVGIKCTISSYINNLHPHRHGDLYVVLEEVIAAAIPLWNETLMAKSEMLADKDPLRQLRIPYTQVEYDGDLATLTESLHDEGLYKTYWEALRAARLKCIIYPEPEPFQAPPETESDAVSRVGNLPFVYWCTSDGLQVIVKLATIELTPEKPTYDGGVWHVEGQLNEHICATALYYYSCENITESRLGFRHLCEAGTLRSQVGSAENDWHLFLEPIFGCKNEKPAVQDVGSVVCKEGRLVTFPNTLMHRVLPFQLADPTKPGHCKILALFLVDPNLHVISTSSIPPQRMDWWREQVFIGENRLGSLSSELRDKIVGYLDFPLTMDDAKSRRLELMEERKELDRVQAEGRNFVRFSLCEH